MTPPMRLPVSRLSTSYLSLFSRRTTDVRPSLFRRAGALPARLSSSSADNQKAPSPHVKFYKLFARPTLKVLTMAFLSYQILYWSWMKLENEGLRREMEEEIRLLEEDVRKLAEEKKGATGVKGKRILEE